jgi:hypothetical protein
MGASSNRGRFADRAWIGDAAGVGGRKVSISRLSDTLSAVNAAERLMLSGDTAAGNDAGLGDLEFDWKRSLAAGAQPEHVAVALVSAAATEARRGLTGALDEHALRFRKCWFIVVVAQSSM